MTKWITPIISSLIAILIGNYITINFIVFGIPSQLVLFLLVSTVIIMAIAFVLMKLLDKIIGD
jgi:hypothetical protein